MDKPYRLNLTNANVETIAELPAPGPWRFMPYNGGFMCASPNHAPRFVKDGVTTVIEALPPDCGEPVGTFIGIVGQGT